MAGKPKQMASMSIYKLLLLRDQLSLLLFLPNDAVKQKPLLVSLSLSVFLNSLEESASFQVTQNKLFP